MESKIESQSIVAPDWLPEMLQLSNDWAANLKIIFSVFKNDFIDHCTLFRDKPIWWNKTIDNGYPEGFWHLIERENYLASERQFDPDRAIRLPWCSPVISNDNDPEIQCWDYKEKNNKVNTYLWLKKHNYLVILHKREINKNTDKSFHIAFLISSFYVQTRKILDLEKRYENRVI